MTDLTVTGSSYAGKAQADPAISAQAIRTRAADYLAGTDTDPADPLVSPIFADLSGLPPLLIQAGSHEVLLDDATRLAAKAAADDVAVILDITPASRTSSRHSPPSSTKATPPSTGPPDSSRTTPLRRLPPDERHQPPGNLGDRAAPRHQPRLLRTPKPPDRGAARRYNNGTASGVKTAQRGSSLRFSRLRVDPRLTYRSPAEEHRPASLCRRFTPSLPRDAQGRGGCHADCSSIS